MASNEDLKKAQRKADEHLPPRKCRRGRQQHQKMKPYLVLQYLQANTDETHSVSASEISGYLEEILGINADRRSIYSDIDEINAVAWMLENDTDIDEAYAAIKEEDAEKLIVYDRKKGGYNITHRKFEVHDLRVIAECIYSAKFLTEKKAKNLIDVVCGFVSENEAEQIRHKAFLTDRVKTDNQSVLNNISIINDAMSHSLDDKRHTPEKISFKYLKHSISDMSQQVERRKGTRYTVSPFQLLINDGNYYLLAFDDYSQDMRTYRVDRMKDISFTSQPREGEEAFKKIDLKTYTKRVFSMFGGKQKLVTIRFINPLLDAVVDRFGTTDFQYAKVDDTHFSVSGYIEISDQFFGWLLGFGNKAKLLYPDDTIQELSDYLERIRSLY